jgi:tyrosinase
VGKMMAAAESDPKSWVFQWYTHWVKGPQAPVAAVVQAKSDELNRIFPNGGPNRDLAQDMWDTCQAHGQGIFPTDDPNFPPEDERYFLPWHRMYVYFFERIIRSVSGVPNFTLPYWNYSTMDANRGVIPPEFRMQGDATFGSLYIAERNKKSDQGADVNAGDPIQDDSPTGGPGDPLSLASLNLPTYYEPDPPGGFCDQLDLTLHGHVHSLVGNLQNMGQVPFAARDPIFWMHHCNIDRLWASWNAAGGANPSLSQQFVFADENGQRVQMDISQFMDQLEPTPALLQPRAAMVAAALRSKTHATTPAPTALGEGPTSVNLEPVPAAAIAAAVAVPERVRAMGPRQRLHLVVRGMNTEAAPGVLYGIYIDLPPNPTPAQLKAHSVGVVNFFHAVGHGAHGHGLRPPSKSLPTAGASRGMFVTFDITEVAKTALANGRLQAKPTLTIIPYGKPAAGVRPVVESFSLIEI